IEKRTDSISRIDRRLVDVEAAEGPSGVLIHEIGKKAVSIHALFCFDWSLFKTRSGHGVAPLNGFSAVWQALINRVAGTGFRPLMESLISSQLFSRQLDRRWVHPA